VYLANKDERRIAPTDLKLLTAVLVVLALSIPTIRQKVVRS
jgi:ABC-type uncharacterized transport system permease subunit